MVVVSRDRGLVLKTKHETSRRDTRSLPCFDRRTTIIGSKIQTVSALILALERCLAFSGSTCQCFCSVLLSIFMCCFRRHCKMVDTAAMDTRLLSPAIAHSFVEVPSNSGRLYYLLSDLPPSYKSTSSSRSRDAFTCLSCLYYRPRTPRRSADLAAHYITRKLARSRENAKRFLRLSFSQNPSLPPPVQPIPISAETEAEVSRLPSPLAEEMVSAETGRQSPQRRSRNSSIVSGPISGMVSRPHLNEELRNASIATNITTSEAYLNLHSIADEKPVVAQGGVSVSIALAEPILFLQGFDQNDTTSRSTTMLRGSLLLRVQKQAKLKSISLNFRGRSTTDWPEGIPPKRTEFRDEITIMNHTWAFFSTQMPQAEHGYCADIVQLSKGLSTIGTKELGVTGSSFDMFQRSASPSRNSVSGPTMNARDAKRLSLQLNQSRSLEKGEKGPNSVASKGFKVFHPGDYVYNFELPIDSRLPESIAVDLGNVKYELEATIERSGAFRTNLVGTKELTLVRAPTEGSLEQTEPIAISRNWEDQLHYDIVISGKSFPLGAQVPIAFKLTPLAKVQCHRIKVFVTENIQYFTNNKKVHRLEPTRKVQLFEKRADGRSTSSYPGSSMRITAGGGIPYDHREAAASGREDTPRDVTNLLGDLENNSTAVGPTEMEFNVQLPSCHAMKEKLKSERIHPDTTSQIIQVNHWIKV